MEFTQIDQIIQYLKDLADPAIQILYRQVLIDGGQYILVGVIMFMCAIIVPIGVRRVRDTKNESSYSWDEWHCGFQVAFWLGAAVCFISSIIIMSGIKVFLNPWAYVIMRLLPGNIGG